jgi:hypothetical protein
MIDEAGPYFFGATNVERYKKGERKGIAKRNSGLCRGL